MLMAIAGAFLLAATFLGLWLKTRSGDAALNRRLGRVAGALGGDRAEEPAADVAVSVFRDRRAKSRLRERLDRRFCMLDDRGAYPRAAAAGLLTAVVIAIVAGFMQFGLLILLLAPAAWAAGAWGFLTVWDSRVRAEFVKQFPEIVDHVVRFARAGLPAVEALSAVAADAPEPTRQILRRISDELSSGLDPDTVLRDAAAHIRISEFTLFTAALALQRSTGGSIATTLGNLAATVRARMEVDTKAYASTAQTRMTLWVLAAVPVVVLAGQSFTNPDSLAVLFETESGAKLLRWGVGLIVAGLLVARSIAARFSR